MAGDIEQRIKVLITELNKIAEASDITENQLKRFTQVLEAIGGISGQFAPKLSKVATVINQVAGALANVGASESYINRLRNTLFELTREYDKFGAAQRQLQKLAGLPPAERMAGMMEFRRQRNIQEEYYRKAAMTITPEQAGRMTADQIRDEIGARATALRLADEMQRRVLQIAVNERQATLEVQAQREAFRELVNQIKAEVEAERELARIREEAAFAQTPEGKLQQLRQLALERSLQQQREDLAARGRQAQIPEPIPLREALAPYEAFIPGGETGIKNLQTRLESLGVTQVNSIRATRELSNGITSMSVSMTESSGAVVRGTVHMDRFGNVLRDTSRRFRGFADAVGTNIIKVTQWAAATGIVYGIIRQLNQVFKEIIQIQRQLADVQVALGASQGNLNTVFEEALNIANLTSSSVGGVVEAYALAYRATGSYTNEAERLAVTNNLLQESMILSKLAGIDQATALDTLTGALRQVGMELDQGRDLLDKWVFVSRQANVSLDTLAQTYSIVGSTAQGVGIEMEELNALAATLAEATGLSATETGNAIRGIISGFQSATAEQTLARFGLATRDATGQLRDFMDLYLELAKLTQSGVLSDRDISEIAQAVGGGYRRAAQVETLFKNNQRVLQLTAEQAQAGGAATEALEIKMATLESAITRLGNAFTKFAQTLGEEGGFLNVITTIVDAMTGFLNVITELVGGLGKATPAVLAFGAAWAVLASKRGQDIFKGLIGAPAPGFMTGAAMRFGTPLAEQQLLSARLAGVTGGPGIAGAYTVGGAFQSLRTGLGARLGGLDPLSLIAPLLIAGSAIRTGITEEEPLEFGRAATSIVGAIVGGIVTAGNPLGIAAGSAMASSFYQGLIQFDDDLAAWWAEIVRKGEEEADSGEETGKAIEDSFGFGARLIAGVSSMLVEGFQWLSATGQGGLFGTGVLSRRGQEEVDPRAFLTGLAMQRTGIDVGLGDNPFLRWLVPEDLAEQVMDELNRQLVDLKLEGVGLEDSMTEVIENLKGTVGPVFDDFIQDMQRKLVLGDISLPEFIKIPQTMNVNQLATQLATLTTAADFAGLNLDIQEFSRFIMELDNATRDYVVTVSYDVIKALAAYKEEIKLNGYYTQRATELQEDYNKKLQFYKEMLPAIQQQQQLAQVPRLQVFDVGRATPQQVQMATSLAKQFQRAYFLALADGNEELADLMEEQVEPILLRYGEGLGQRFGESIAVGAQYMTEAFQTLGFEDLLEDVQFQFQDLRDSLTMGQIPELMERYSKVVGTFQTYFPQYEVEESDLGLITKDGLTTVHADLTLLNLAMQDLIDVNEQQLEGVWNIPAGMTAMVAWSSLFSREIVAGTTTSAFEDVFTEERKDKAVAMEETNTLASLEASLLELNEAIAGYKQLLEMGPEALGMHEYLATQDELQQAELQKTALLEQIAMAQLSGGLGLTPTGDVNMVDQLREALTIQNKIELNANIRLVVDGRTLANIVKQYLFEDLVSAADKVSGTGSGDYVVGR